MQFSPLLHNIPSLSEIRNADFFHPLSNTNMQESKFLIHGQHVRQHDGYTRNDCLSFMSETAEDAVTTCRKLYPDYVINYVELDDSEVEVVKLQSLI